MLPAIAAVFLNAAVATLYLLFHFLDRGVSSLLIDYDVEVPIPGIVTSLDLNYYIWIACFTVYLFLLVIPSIVCIVIALPPTRSRPDSVAAVILILSFMCHMGTLFLPLDIEFITSVQKTPHKTMLEVGLMHLSWKTALHLGFAAFSFLFLALHILVVVVFLKHRLGSRLSLNLKIASLVIIILVNAGYFGIVYLRYPLKYIPPYIQRNLDGSVQLILIFTGLLFWASYFFEIRRLNLRKAGKYKEIHRMHNVFRRY